MINKRKYFLFALLIASIFLARLAATSPKSSVKREPTAKVVEAPSLSQVRARAVASQGSASTTKEFFAASRGEWLVKMSPSGFIESMKGGSYRSPGLRSDGMAADFLALWAKPLFGVGADALQPVARRGGGGAHQYVYEQALHGLRVIGSGVNLHFDREGNLVYAAASTYPGELPRLLPKYSQAEAVRPVREAMSAYFAERGLELRASGSIVREQGMNLSYRLVRGSISLVYRTELPLQAPLYGTIEAIVDAQTNSLVVFRPLAKN